MQMKLSLKIRKGTNREQKKYFVWIAVDNTVVRTPIQCTLFSCNLVNNAVRITSYILTLKTTEALLLACVEPFSVYESKPGPAGMGVLCLNSLHIRFTHLSKVWTCSSYSLDTLRCKNKNSLKLLNHSQLYSMKSKYSSTSHKKLLFHNKISIVEIIGGSSGTTSTRAFLPPSIQGVVQSRSVYHILVALRLRKML